MSLWTQPGLYRLGSKSSCSSANFWAYKRAYSGLKQSEAWLCSGAKYKTYVRFWRSNLGLKKNGICTSFYGPCFMPFLEKLSTSVFVFCFVYFLAVTKWKRCKCVRTSTTASMIDIRYKYACERSSDLSVAWLQLPWNRSSHCSSFVVSAGLGFRLYSFYPRHIG